MQINDMITGCLIEQQQLWRLLKAGIDVAALVRPLSRKLEAVVGAR